jgi:hypothetical protein
MIYFETIGEISNSSTTFVCVRDYDDFVATVDEILLWVSFYNRRWKYSSIFRDLVRKLTVDSW